MFGYYSVARRLARERDALKNRVLGLEAEIKRLKNKDEQRLETLFEWNMAWADRFLTSQAKTHAIRDAVKEKTVTNEDVKNAALDDYLADKKAFLVECAIEAGKEDPEAAAKETFEQNYAAYVLEFQSQ